MKKMAVLCENVAAGNIAEVKNMIEKNNVDPKQGDQDQRTPLHIAASLNNLEMVEYLVSKGSVNSLDKFGTFPIQNTTDDKCRLALQKAPFVYSETINHHEFGTQIIEVMNTLLASKEYSFNAIAQEVQGFYFQQGIDPWQFKNSSVIDITNQIKGMIAGKLLNNLSTENNLYYDLETKNKFFCGISDTHEMRIKAAYEINKQLNNHENLNKQIKVQMVKTEKPVDSNQDGSPVQANLLQVDLQDECKELKNSDVLSEVSADILLKEQEERNTLETMTKLMKDGCSKPGPTVFEETRQDTIKISLHDKRGLRTDDSNSTQEQLMPMIFKIADNLGINQNKLQFQTFMNHSHIYTLQISPDTPKNKIEVLKNDLNDLALIPAKSSFMNQFLSGDLNIDQLNQSISCIDIVYQFWHLKNGDLEDLQKFIKDDARQANHVMSLREEVIKTPSQNAIVTHMTNNLELLNKLKDDFDQQLKLKDFTENDALLDEIKSIPDHQVRHTYEKIYNFNRSVMATNITQQYRQVNTYRLDPTRLIDLTVFPEVPYGIQQQVSHLFRGFHTRFRDISRGGIRIVKSTPDSYSKNRHNMFKEAQGLAYTQKLKNKDIAENGSKGIIGMQLGCEYLDLEAQKCYIEGIANIMNRDEGITFKLPINEILFLGPDENTADKMDMACLYSKTRGNKYWRAFTTGKSPQLGGVPHDTQGMTTRSVRQFVTGIYRKLGLEQKDVTKIITGGPDGDLGSNEILMGQEKIVGIVDGSGVLQDPNGIQRSELERLAKERKMIEHFKGKLGAGGYQINVKDKNVKLPNGEKIISGETFRNTFLLRDDISCDMLVPCGGRPETINPYNQHKLFKNGQPRYKYLVEGANLFVTEAVRPKLQQGGMMLFKDASTNKGGVTSSSLEVLAALSVPEAEFMTNFTIQQDGKVPKMYEEYVQEVIERVEENARLEFEYVYKEITEQGAMSNEATNKVSIVMNDLFDVIQDSSLYEDEELRHAVLKAQLPKLLVKNYGQETLYNNLPDNYRRTAFSVQLSSKFVQDQGSKYTPIDFISYISKYKEKL